MFTRHAQTRIQQRGIHPGIVELIVDFGEETHLNGGVTLHSLGKRGMRRLRREYGDCLRILIEDKFGSQKRFAKQFKPHVSPTDISLMCRGEKPKSNYFARSVENDLALPIGWFDQKNWEFFYLPQTKHQLFEKLVRLELLHKNSRKVPRIWNRHCT